jgi:hypothetical protein
MSTLTRDSSLNNVNVADSLSVKKLKVESSVVSGALNAFSLNLTGGNLTVGAGGVTYLLNTFITGTLNAGATTLTGALTATSATLSGALTGTSATLSGALTGTSATLSGALTAGSASLGAGALTAGAATLASATLSGALTAAGATLTGSSFLTSGAASISRPTAIVSAVPAVTLSEPQIKCGTLVLDASSTIPATWNWPAANMTGGLAVGSSFELNIVNLATNPAATITFGVNTANVILKNTGATAAALSPLPAIPNQAAYRILFVVTSASVITGFVSSLVL